MSSRTDLEDIKGREILGMIGEPWDFSSLAGEGRVAGFVSEISDAKDQKEWIKLSIEQFLHEGAEISQILCVSRYSQKTGIFKGLLAGDFVGLNMFFNKFGKDLSYEDVRNYHPINQNISFLVGSIKLII